MSIRLKLILSYIVLIVSSVIIISVIFMGASIDYINNLVTENNENNLFNDMDKKLMNAILEVEYFALNQPEMFKDRDYLDKLGEELDSKNIGILIFEDGKIVFKSEIMDDPVILDTVNNFSSYISKAIGEEATDTKDTLSALNIRIKDQNYLLLRQYYLSSSGTDANIYIAMDTTLLDNSTNKFITKVTISIVIVMLLMVTFLSFVVSRSILKPLKKLEYGTNQIKNGNLDFSLKVKEKDELGRLCNAFDTMRIELQNSIQKQLQYEENKKELISIISHDLRTPITAIKGYVEGIMDNVADTPEKQERYLQVIYNKAKDMEKLIEDLFLLSKLDLNRIELQLERTNLKQYFDDCVQELRLECTSRDIRLEYIDEMEEECFSWVDPQKLKQVIMNIVQNANKYMDKEEKRIEMKVMSYDRHVVVSIKDNGIGIKKEELSNIFEMFYRADKSRSANIGGSGLGLAIAKQIIERHNGSIWADSVFGEYTIINFSLPKEQKI